MHLSSTSPTRKMTFTPSRGERGALEPVPPPIPQARGRGAVALTVAEEHVPNPQDRGPGQGPGEGAHEPFGHVEDGLHLVFLQMAVGYGGDAPQQSKQDLSIELDRFLRRVRGEKETKELKPDLQLHQL